MSCKIITGEEAGRAMSIVWQQAGGESGWAPSNAAAGAGGQSGSGEAALEAQLARLESEMAAREERARQAGYQQGQQETARKLEAPLREAVDRLATQIEELAQLRRRLRHEAEKQLVSLAVAIARRVLRRELTADPGAILGIVKAALEQVDAREVLRIRVHPDDVPLLERSLDSRRFPDKLEIVADRDLERGGVVVETERGSLDASVETQLAEIERGFADLARR